MIVPEWYRLVCFIIMALEQPCCALPPFSANSNNIDSNKPPQDYETIDSETFSGDGMLVLPEDYVDVADQNLRDDQLLLVNRKPAKTHQDEDDSMAILASEVQKHTSQVRSDAAMAMALHNGNSFERSEKVSRSSSNGGNQRTTISVAEPSKDDQSDPNTVKLRIAHRPDNRIAQANTPVMTLDIQGDESTKPTASSPRLPTPAAQTSIGLGDAMQQNVASKHFAQSTGGGRKNGNGGPVDKEARLRNHQSHTHYAQAYSKWLKNLKDNYDGHIRPNFGVDAVVVYVSLYVIAFRRVSEIDMDYTIEVYFRQYWDDARLAFDPADFGGRNDIDLDATARALLWVPDTNLVNSISSMSPHPTDTSAMSHMMHTRVSSEGEVFQTKRVSITADCQLDLRLYPFDDQVCKLIMSSYGFRASDILYRWNYPRAIDMHSTTELPDFYIRSYKTRAFNSTYSTGGGLAKFYSAAVIVGKYSTIEFCFILRRNYGYCVVQLLFPATVLVAASWISLWLEEEMVFSDVIGVILSILFLSYSYNNVMPKVSYVKGMDIYMGACLLFVFLSLVKMAVVKYMRKRAKRKDEEAKAKQRERAASCFTPNLAVGPTGAEGGSTASIYSDAKQRRSSKASKEELKEEEEEKVEQQRQTILDLASKGAAWLLVARMHEATLGKLKKHRSWHYLKAFHIGSQILLPVAFGGFCVFFFFVYPAMQKEVVCWEK